jgi:hypothetical protein
MDKPEGNEAEDFLKKVIVKIVITAVLMAASVVAGIYYIGG